MSGASLDRVLDRVRKLLALSKSANEHEAANAAAAAARLMQEYEIEEAQLRVGDPAAAPAEPIRDGVIQAGNRYVVTWRMNLASGIARGLGAYAFYAGADIKVYGRTSVIQTVTYMYQYLAAEIDRLADEHYEIYGVGVNAKSWKNSFRLGAVQTIANRLRDQRRAQFAEFDAKIAATAPESTALVLVKKDAAEVEAAWKRRSEGFVSRTSSGPSQYTAYQRGNQAGASISLGGGPQLGATPKKIGGR